MHQALKAKITPLIEDRNRLQFLIDLMENHEWVTLQEFEEGYRLYTPLCQTRICDSPREAIDSAMKDEYFKRA